MLTGRFEDIIKLLEQAERVLLLPHLHADGDALGSCGALAAFLKASGKEVTVLTEEPVEPKLEFLPALCGAEFLPMEETIAAPYDLAVAIDSSAPDRLGTPRIAHPNDGFELLQGPPVFEGKILGGCIESIYDLLTGSRYGDEAEICSRYGLFPDAADWKGRILLLETSEEKPDPGLYVKALGLLKDRGVLDAVSGVLLGKPMDGTFQAEYREAILRVAEDPRLPIVANLSVGHATPRCILPFGVPARVDVRRQEITFHP